MSSRRNRVRRLASPRPPRVAAEVGPPAGSRSGSDAPPLAPRPGLSAADVGSRTCLRGPARALATRHR
ncbi:hypothetical protein VH88_13680 [Brevundimonas sp. KM4]|nr:hypothetical protein VH88_13680 [Brevundimonas sp. KM4]